MYYTKETLMDMVSIDMEENFKHVLNCAGVHSALSPGLLENAYEECLYYEMVQCGLKVEKQKVLPLVYRTVKLKAGYRIDLFVEKQILLRSNQM